MKDLLLAFVCVFVVGIPIALVSCETTPTLDRFESAFVVDAGAPDVESSIDLPTLDEEAVCEADL